MTMTKDEALKLALSTLDEVRQETFRLMRDGQKLYAEDKVWSTIISIKEVLAQPELDDAELEKIMLEVWQPVPPEQEPVAWGVFEGNLHDMFFSPSEAQEMADLKGTHAEARPLYTTPPQRKPLTDEQILAANYPDGEENGPTIAAPDFELICFARQIEATHNIKE